MHAFPHENHINTHSAISNKTEYNNIEISLSIQIGIPIQGDISAELAQKNWRDIACCRPAAAILTLHSRQNVWKSNVSLGMCHFETGLSFDFKTFTIGLNRFVQKWICSWGNMLTEFKPELNKSTIGVNATVFISYLGSRIECFY